jgi:hypothetical protein
MSKTEADNCKKIEIWWLLRDIKDRGGYKYTTVTWGENGSHGRVSVEVSINNTEKYARFIYTQTDNHSGEKKDFDYRAEIVTTSCHLGGERYWFRCPLYKNKQSCGKRVGVLYKDGDWFGCRHCYELTYSSRNVNKGYKHYSTFRILELTTEIEKLEEKAKRYTYRGKPTKKRERIEKLYSEKLGNYRVFLDTEKGLNFNKKGRKN